MREKDGFAGFVSGSQWYPGVNGYKKKERRYEIGWVGQSASMANAFIYDYFVNGDKDNLELALEAHDAWLKYGTPKKNFISANHTIDTANPTITIFLKCPTSNSHIVFKFFTELFIYL
jgi:hypothetical protein